MEIVSRGANQLCLGRTYSDTREQACLCDTQKQTGDEKTLIVSDNAHEGHDYAPGDHDERQPAARAQLLEHEVGRHLKGRICEEEGGQTPVVFVALEAQIVREAFDIGIADIST